MKSAKQPFQFVTASYLTRVDSEKATSPAELLDGLEHSSDAAIFYHTFHTLSRFHFLAEGFSNDFAQWAGEACNLPKLAEPLAALDVQNYVSIADLRRDLRRIVSEFCRAHPRQAQKKGFEPLYFCEAVEVTLPLDLKAKTLEEFRQRLEGLGRSSLYYHFIASRLRLCLNTNDFSHWLSTSLGLDELARRVDGIDIYANTLDAVQASLVNLVKEELTR